jgi:hypothetical protein
VRAEHVKRSHAARPQSGLGLLQDCENVVTAQSC